MFPACGEGKLEDTPPEPEGLMLVVCAPRGSRGGVPRGGPAEIFCTTVLLFENASLVNFQRVNGAMGAILKKMAVFFARCALTIFYDGGDLEENGRFPSVKRVAR